MGGYQCSPYCDPSYVAGQIAAPYVEPTPVLPQQTAEETEPVRADNEVDIMQYIIIGAAAGGCLLISTLICLIIKCMRKGSDLVEVDPDVSVEHHDTEMASNRQAELNSASDFNENENE